MIEKNKSTESDSNQGSFSISEIYDTLRQEIFLRIGLQNKCVELSIIITTGLLATVIWKLFEANTFQSVTTDSYKNLQAICILLSYGFIQSLLITNYVYHTWVLLRIVNYIKKTTSYDMINDETKLYPGSYESSEFRSQIIGIENILNIFQPLVIYICIGLSSFTSFILLVHRFSIQAASCQSSTILLIISITFIIWMVALTYLHKKATL